MVFADTQRGTRVVLRKQQVYLFANFCGYYNGGWISFGGSFSSDDQTARIDNFISFTVVGDVVGDDFDNYVNSNGKLSEEMFNRLLTVP